MIKVIRLSLICISFTSNMTDLLTYYMYGKSLFLRIKKGRNAQMEIPMQDLDHYLPVSCIKATDGTISHVICTDNRTGSKTIFTMAEIEEAINRFSAIRFLTGEYPE
jgi:hypothetical protein